MSNRHPLEDYIQQQADYFDGLTPSFTKAQEKLQKHISDLVDGFSKRQDQITAEANEYQRHFNGYFALSASFIISGMLASQSSNSDGHAVKIFFFATIAVSLVAALLLFFDYILTYRLFNRWQANIRDCVAYINGLTWKSQDELDDWIRNNQNDLKEKSTHFIQYTEMFLLTVAFGLLLC